MIVSVNSKHLEKTLTNVINYSYGFIDGIEKGKKIFLNNLGKNTVFVLGQYIDAEARANRDALHHVYEWYQTGSPEARLFDLDYIVTNVGLSLNGKFRQSRSIQTDSTRPFFDKARIMEKGVPVVIKPKGAKPLRFYDGGNTIFVKKPITVNNPGGEEVQGAFERVFDEFMMRYFTQAFLKSSGLIGYLNNPITYKKNIAAGAKMGRQKGISVGFKWITNANIGVE